MKKIYSPFIGLLFFALLTSSMVSCKKGGFLEATSVTDLDENSVFTDSARTNAFLADIYFPIGMSSAANRFGNGGLDVASDESYPGNQLPSVATYWATGIINPANVSADVYNTAYSRIRAVNVLFKNISRTKLTLPDGQTGSRAQLIAEARFLRAWYYALLVKHYGGVPLVGDNIYDYTNPIPVKRNTYEECVNYIVSQCDSAASVLGLLGVKQAGLNYGRASKGACMALKARVLLYAASPLFNAGNIGTGDTKLLTGYDGGNVADRWKKARDAAYDLIKTGAYKLNVDNADKNKPGRGFRSLFAQRVNDEYILQWMLAANNWPVQLEAFWLPPSRGGNNGGGHPYQEIVDAFPMIDGKNITESSAEYPYDAQHPYTNRDPRLDYSIIHDQSVLPVRLAAGQYSPVSLYYVMENGNLKGVNEDMNGTPTGYYTNKMLDSNATATDGLRPTQRCQPLIRYAEVLLNYAEAMNEYDGSKADSVYLILGAIRDRAGIKPGADNHYGLKANMSQTELREAIHNERRLELAFEEHRFWDVRRWMTAPVDASKLMHGMRVELVNGNKTYTVFPLLPKHAFDKRMYLWPLPQTEIGKSADLKQNPLY